MTGWPFPAPNQPMVPIKGKPVKDYPDDMGEAPWITQ